MPRFISLRVHALAGRLAHRAARSGLRAQPRVLEAVHGQRAPLGGLCVQVCPAAERAVCGARRRSSSADRTRGRPAHRCALLRTRLARPAACSGADLRGALREPCMQSTLRASWQEAAELAESGARRSARLRQVLRQALGFKIGLAALQRARGRGRRRRTTPTSCPRS